MKFDWDEFVNSPPEEDRLLRTSMNESDLLLEKIWQCAFPEGLKYKQWQQLIYIMYVLDGDDYPMSSRAVASHIGVLLGLNYVILLNEAYGVYEIKPDEEIITWLHKRMEQCGYYKWLDSPPIKIEVETLDELCSLIQQKRPCKRVTLIREPLANYRQADEQETINTFIRSTVKSIDNWNGIQWREQRTHIMWDDMMRIVSRSSDLTQTYMSSEEAHAFVSAILTKLTDLARDTHEYTSHRANGIQQKITLARWQYWLVTVTIDSIGLFGIEED